MAYIFTIITDMGNGCRLCSECEFNLDNGDIFVKIPDSCPRCENKFEEFGKNIKELLKYKI